MNINTTLEEIRSARRTELIFRIAAIAHPETYHQILKWPTAALRSYLADHYLNRKRAETHQKIWG